MKEKWFFIVGLDKKKIKDLELKNEPLSLFPESKQNCSSTNSETKPEIRTEWVIASSPGDAFRKVAARLKISYEEFKKEKVFKYAKKIKKAPTSTKVKIGKKEWRPVFYSDKGVAVHTKTKSGDAAIVYYVKDLNGNVILSRLMSINIYRLRDPDQLELSKKEERICWKNAYLFLIGLPNWLRKREKRKENML